MQPIKFADCSLRVLMYLAHMPKPAMATRGNESIPLTRPAHTFLGEEVVCLTEPPMKLVESL